VSRKASARRCVDLHDDAIAVVFSRAGIIARVYRGKDFPWLNIAANHPLPPRSIAKRASLAVGESSDWAAAPAHQWLENGRSTVSEQSIGQQNGYRMTLLTFEPDNQDQEDDEEVERAWTSPRFGRR
jgi:hypothetical protein